MGIVYGTPIVIINNEDSDNSLDEINSSNIESNDSIEEDK